MAAPLEREADAALPAAAVAVAAAAAALGSAPDRQTGFWMHSSALSRSSPRRILCCGVLPGKRSRVTVSSGSSGTQTRRAQMETRLASGSHSSLPSMLMPDLQSKNIIIFMKKLTFFILFTLPE